MKVLLHSKVNLGHKKVFMAMDERMFRYLLPAGADVVRYDGAAAGDIVHLRFPFGIQWISEITRSEVRSSRAFFIDRGMKLPPPLTYWKHIHRIEKIDEGESLIVDDMEFSTGYFLLDVILYPFIYLAFLPRKWQYRNYFKRINRN